MKSKRKVMRLTKAGLLVVETTGTDAASTFKRAVCKIVWDGVYPSPRKVNALAHGHCGKDLNGRDCRRRADIFKELDVHPEGHTQNRVLVHNPTGVIIARVESERYTHAD